MARGRATTPRAEARRSHCHAAEMRSKRWRRCSAAVAKARVTAAAKGNAVAVVTAAVEVVVAAVAAAAAAAMTAAAAVTAAVEVVVAATTAVATAGAAEVAAGAAVAVVAAAEAEKRLPRVPWRALLRMGRQAAPRHHCLSSRSARRWCAYSSGC